MEHTLDFTYYFLGIGLEASYTGNVLSVEKRDVEYDGQDLKNCIFIKYSIPKLEWDAELNQEEITKIIFSESDIFVKTFYLLLKNPCKLLIFNALVNGVEFEPKYYPDDFRSIYEYLIERNKLAESKGITTLIHKNGWSILEKLVMEFRIKPISIRNKVSLALRWCAKASSELSSIDSLVFYWISFNSLFEGIANSEQVSIEKYIDNNVDLLIAKRLYVKNEENFSRLASLKIELRNKRKVGEALANLLTKDDKDYKSIIKNMALSIYGIRNNLFHGTYDPDATQTRKHIAVANNLLSEFMKEIVAKEMLGYPLSSSVFRVQTKFGIG